MEEEHIYRVTLSQKERDDHTRRLNARANNDSILFKALQAYQKMGNITFQNDLKILEGFPKDKLSDTHLKWITSMIAGLNENQASYEKNRLYVNDAIRRLVFDRASVKDFERNLYIDELRGGDFFDVYEHDMHYALQDFILEMEDKGFCLENGVWCENENLKAADVLSQTVQEALFLHHTLSPARALEGRLDGRG